MHDATVVDHTTRLQSIISTYLLANSSTLIHTLPKSSAFPSLPVEFLQNFESASTPSYLISALHLARLIKTPAEIELIRKANAISSRAHEVIMRLLGRDANGLIQGQANGAVMPAQWRIEKEAEAEAVFVASCRREG